MAFAITTILLNQKAEAEIAQRIYPIEDNIVVCGLNCETERKATFPAHETSFTYGLTGCQNTPYFLKFDVSGVTNFPGKGILRLGVLQEGSGTYDPNYASFRAVQVGNDWNDNTITFDTQPAELDAKQNVIINNPGISQSAPYQVFIPLKNIKTENGFFSIKVEDTLSKTCDDWVIIGTVDNPIQINRPYFEFSLPEALHPDTQSPPPQYSNPSALPSTFDFSINSDVDSLLVATGGEISTMVWLNLISGGPQEVTLDCSGLPINEAKCIINNKVITGTSNGIKLIVSAEPGSPAGVHNITVTGKGGGKIHSDSISVTITPKGQVNENAKSKNGSDVIVDVWLPALVTGIVSAIVGAFFTAYVFIRRKKKGKQTSQIGQ